MSALLALPREEFGKAKDPTIKNMIEERPVFKPWQWTALLLVCQVLTPIRALIKLLVGTTIIHRCELVSE